MRAAATGRVGAIAVRIIAFGNRGLRGRAQSAAHIHTNMVPAAPVSMCAASKMLVAMAVALLRRNQFWL